MASVYKSKKGNKFITDIFFTINEVLKVINDNKGTDIKIFKSNNGGIHSYKIHFFGTFKSNENITNEKVEKYFDFHNGNNAKFVKPCDYEKVMKNKTNEESIFWKMAWDDGRY
ncbi:MAG: hypothetical protein ACM3O3_12995 [Syntrophothermus sp.]